MGFRDRLSSTDILPSLTSSVTDEDLDVSWNVYVLRQRETLDLFHDVNERAQACLKTNPQEHYQLAFEGKVWYRLLRKIPLFFWY